VIACLVRLPRRRLTDADGPHDPGRGLPATPGFASLPSKPLRRRAVVRLNPSHGTSTRRDHRQDRLRQMTTARCRVGRSPFGAPSGRMNLARNGNDCALTWRYTSRVTAAVASLDRCRCRRMWTRAAVIVSGSSPRSSMSEMPRETVRRHLSAGGQSRHVWMSAGRSRGRI